MQLRRREAVVCLPRSGLRPEGSAPYGAGRYFLCRHCYDLVYESQRDNVMYRAFHKAQAILKCLGGSAHMMEPFPERPKGMHWKTYEIPPRGAPTTTMEQLIGMSEWLDKLEKKVG
jgi:hypothetical protein